MDMRYSLTVLLLVVAVSSAAVTYGPEKHMIRVRRQDSSGRTTSSQDNPKQRPSNIFRLLSTLLAETRDDTRRAFKEIGDLFNSQFSPQSLSTSRPITTYGSTTSNSTATSAADGDEVTTTTEPYRITREEFNGILRSNFRGILLLFGKELRNALKDSGRNVIEFGREFRSQLRPYVEIRNGSKSS